MDDDDDVAEPEVCQEMHVEKAFLVCSRKQNDEQFAEAKKAELGSWERHNVYTTVPEGQDRIDTRWDLNLKMTEHGEKLAKARLVARGFQEDSGILEKTSPTCRKDSIRVLLTISASFGWKLRVIDIKTAFLQGRTLERNVYLLPPKEAEVECGFVWKLNQCVYGLTDASRHWYDKVVEVLLETGIKVSNFDSALFYDEVENQLQGVLCSHVDDFLWGGSERFEHNVSSHLRTKFLIGKVDTSDDLSCLGLSIELQNKTIAITQSGYSFGICLIEELAGNETRLATSTQVSQLRTAIGQLIWLSGQSRDLVWHSARALLQVSV